ncbi:MBL fold metallo-hydrolase [Alteromonas lipotrueiana]|uniref:MBL fold metallo-hydrolase n=1 Tax=Alteromonas lipotrueiana TaxID=2803815 RepID=UPI001FEB7764|nr:MBL fold metallo-hydrolase [Alteromonas lipotrueiana]
MAFMSRLIFTLAMILSLKGCGILATSNSVVRITHESGPVNRASDGRYHNMFSGEKDYPVTCDKNCYPNFEQLKCNKDNGECLFSGVNQIPKRKSGFDVTWLGHASFMVTLPDNTTLLFDPVSGQFDWPINWLHALNGGMTRNLPDWPDSAKSDVDAVLYSHLHYDHFNKADIKKLGSKPVYFVQQDTADYLPQQGLSVKEMSWFSKYQLGSVTVRAVPAHHFNSRYWIPLVYDDNEKALWGGWIIEYEGQKLFFAGDTGYSAHFKTIRQRYGSIDVCLLPIASYYHSEYANWYRYVHTTPEDALVAAKDLDCKVMIPWGYGNASWQMGDHSSHSPLKRLLKMHKKVNTSLPLVIMNEGKKVSL